MFFITAVNVDGIDLVQRLATARRSTTWTRAFWTRGHKRDLFPSGKKVGLPSSASPLGDRYRDDYSSLHVFQINAVQI